MSVFIGMLTFDCADAAALARFWSQVVERPVDDGATEQYATISMGEPTGQTLMFVQVPEGKSAKNRFHPDLSAPAWRVEIERMVRLGATRLGEHEMNGARWVSLADPEGNEFDVFAPRSQQG